MAFEYKIFWTSEAINNLDSILSYLKNSWTQRETENFKNRLSKQLILIQQNPYLFPISQYNSRLRRAVLSKQITVFYEVSGLVIYLLYLFNNKQNIESIR